MPKALFMLLILIVSAAAGQTAVADEGHEHTAEGHAESDDAVSGLMMPIMNPARGRKLFASKGCVACHAVNGVGGTDAPPFDASTTPTLVNPFSFAARMWRGAETMIALQREVFDEQINLTGQELADIIGFVYNVDEQKRFSNADVPHDVLELIEHTHGGHTAHGHEDEFRHDRD